MAIIRVDFILRIWSGRVIIRNDVRNEMDVNLLLPESIKHPRKKLKIIMLNKHIVPQKDMELTLRKLPRCFILRLRYDVEEKLNVLP